MRIPVWLTIVAAIFVTAFGVFRLYVATRKPDPNEPPPRSGFHRMSKRTHGLLGVVYLMLGAGLFAVALGWNPFGDMFAVKSKTPTKDEAPTKTQVPVDQLPSKK
jgi:hypothetical protein